MLDVANVNATFPKYPKTVEDKGWIYGVWYCGTAWHKSTLYGQYPPTFLKRALALFPTAQEILHCPSGKVIGPGVTMDRVHDGVRVPQVVGDAVALPFQDESFDLVLSDPPYSADDAKKYGCKPFPLNRFCREVHRVLKPNGCFGMLHFIMANYNRKDWTPRAMIAVVTGSCKKVRLFSVLQKGES